MLLGEFITIGLIAALAGCALLLWWSTSQRSAQEVVLDLSEAAGSHDAARQGRFVLNDKLGAIGLYDEPERRRFQIQSRLIPIGLMVSLLSYNLVRGHVSFGNAALSCLIGLGLGYLASQSAYRRRQARFIREVEFYLPIVMERMVMAVQAGLDIIPALKGILALDNSEQDGPPGGNKNKAAADPVSRLLGIVCELTEAGLSFEQALRDVAGMIECAALRHAFIHLAVAQREGGEIIMPLRELSDSTQLYYQESIEEEIAKMPVKATLPLLCTFAGLVIFFITSPIIQVLSMTMKVMPK